MPSIAVKDFGPIASADVELKPLTVFVGANNSGKSYMALAVYALFRAFRHRGQRDVHYPRTASWNLTTEISVDKSNELMDHYAHFTDEFDQYFAGNLPFGKLPDPVLGWVHSESKNWNNNFDEDLSYQLKRCFGSTLSQLGRVNDEHHRKDFVIEARDENSGMIWTVRCDKDKLAATIQSDSIARRSVFLDSLRLRPERLIEYPILIPHLLLRDYAGLVTRNFSATSYYMPASRSGIFLEHKTLARSIIGMASIDWIEPNKSERLTGIVADLIQALLSVQPDKIPADGIGEIIEFLESNILMGEVCVDTTSEYPIVQYNSSLGKFQLHQVSSMISEVAPLALFLKNFVTSGDLFIFEEPESHLNPLNQSRIARAIAMLVNAGVRVLITTHSDFLLTQINNLMQASLVQSSKGRHGTSYSDAEILNPNDVSAYIFQPGQDGTQVESLEIDEDYGISTESFDEVHSALYNEAIMMEHIG